MKYFKIRLFVLLFTLFITVNLFSLVKSGQVKKDSVALGYQENIFYNQIKVETFPIEDTARFMKDLDQIIFISATIYFYGNGFPQTVAGKLMGNGGAFIKQFLKKFVSGSKIAFENCEIKQNDGSLIKSYNKIIYFK